MRRYWWKILAVLLISYAFIKGLSTPLSPAIVQADKIEENKGVLELAVKGYNASYGEAMSVWLRNGANEIGHEDETAFEYGDEQQIFAAVFLAHDGTEFIDSALQRLFIDQHMIDVIV